MAIQGARVLVTTGALLAVAIVATAGWASNEAGASLASQKRPWIEVPAGNQFGSDRHSRTLLLDVWNLTPKWSDAGALATSCGDPHQTHAEERYTVTFSTDWVRLLLSRVVDIHDEVAWIDVDGTFGIIESGQFLRSYGPLESHRANLSELTEIQQAWSDPRYGRRQRKPAGNAYPAEAPCFRRA